MFILKVFIHKKENKSYDKCPIAINLSWLGMIFKESPQKISMQGKSRSVCTNRNYYSIIFSLSTRRGRGK